MKAIGRLLLVAISLTGFGPGAFAQGARAGDIVPGRYIVQLRDVASAAAVSQRHGLRPTHVYHRTIRGFAGEIPPGQLQRLQQDPDVLRIVPDRIVTAISDPIQAKKGKPGGGSSGQVVPAGVLRVGANTVWTLVTGRGVGVAVLDTGLDHGHADLNIGGTLYDPFDGDGQDRNGHGTHVGGIIAAKNNTRDVVGVAPEATLYSVRVLDNTGTGTDATIIGGLESLLTEEHRGLVRVANLSLGRPAAGDDDIPLHQAVQSVVAAGITVVVAAGNDCGREVNDLVPARFPEVIAVASTTATDGRANRRGVFIPADTASYFATDGNWFDDHIGVTISAPGETREDVNNANLIQSVGILSTRLGGGTTSMSGSSMAAPHVAGAVALLLQADPSLAPEELRTVLIATADRPGVAPLDSPTRCYTFDGFREGILNVPAALGAVLGP
ncbi:MAG: S8 family serine peptidase [Limisphaera sp.]